MVTSKKAKIIDKIAIGIIWSGALMAVATLLWIIGYITIKGIPVINSEFILGYPRGINLDGGIFPTIVSSLYITALTLLFAAPLGIGAAVYLAEYAADNKFTCLIRFLSDSLASVPSIVFGLFGMVLFVEILGFGWSLLSGALTLTLMILPVVIRTSEESIRSVPDSYRQASFGIGATKWQTIRNIILPSASPGILTGIILGLGRAFGETAALLFTAGSARIINPENLPISPLDNGGSTMTIHLFKLASLNRIESALGVAFLLLIVVLLINQVMNLLMRKLRARFVA